MKKLVLAVTALALSAVSASAADLAARPYTKAPILPPVYDWSGFYIGVNGGGGWSHNCFSDPISGFSDGCHTASGGMAGGQFGWRTQAGWLVWGFDAQGDWANIKGSNLSAGPSTGTVFSSNTNGFASIAATAGYAANNWLFYAKAGGAFLNNKWSTFTPAGAPGGPLVTSLQEGRWGGLLGAGIEYGITYNWTIGVEYNHIFGGAVDNAIGPNALAQGERVSQNGIDLVTARINYKFGGPVIARY